jgi:hypothetical protein
MGLKKVQPFPNSALSEKNSKDAINSVLFFKAFPLMGGYASQTLHPEAPQRISKRAELEKG